MKTNYSCFTQFKVLSISMLMLVCTVFAACSNLIINRDATSSKNAGIISDEELKQVEVLKYKDEVYALRESIGKDIVDNTTLDKTITFLNNEMPENFNVDNDFFSPIDQIVYAFPNYILKYGNTFKGSQIGDRFIGLSIIFDKNNENVKAFNFNEVLHEVTTTEVKAFYDLHERFNNWVKNTSQGDIIPTIQPTGDSNDDISTNDGNGLTEMNTSLDFRFLFQAYVYYVKYIVKDSTSSEGLRISNTGSKYQYLLLTENKAYLEVLYRILQKTDKFDNRILDLFKNNIKIQNSKDDVMNDILVAVKDLNERIDRCKNDIKNSLN